MIYKYPLISEGWENFAITGELKFIDRNDKL
jgi:hypothetical protein